MFYVLKAMQWHSNITDTTKLSETYLKNPAAPSLTYSKLNILNYWFEFIFEGKALENI